MRCKCLCSTAALAAAALPSTKAFISPPSRSSYDGVLSKKLSSTKEDKETKQINGGWNIGSPSRKMEEAKKKKRVAKEALTKLLERQERDVQQTLQLIQDLEVVYDQFEHQRQHKEDADIFNDNFNISSLTENAPSITASVAAGADYGYISRSEGCRYESINDLMNANTIDERFEDYGPPGNIFSLGSQQFMRNLRAMIGEYKDEEDNTKLTDKQRELQSKLRELTLNSDAIWDRERARGEIVAPWIIKIPYFVLCYMLDVVFEGVFPFSRFFLLETVARMPYFSYITMLHLYETLGFWRRSADIKRIHFAEEWNVSSVSTTYHTCMHLGSLMCYCKQTLLTKSFAT